MTTRLVTLNRPDVSAVVDVLQRDGAVIVTGLLAGEQVSGLRRRLEALLAHAPYGNAFGGRRTRRVSGLLATAPECHPLVLDDVVHGAAEAYLRPWSKTLLLHLTQAIELHPGQTTQTIHRDRLGWGGHLPREIEPQINTIWAITDFTAANGATRVVPGSHRWREGRRPTEDEITQAVMPAGSVVIYVGSVLHGGGENRSDGTRLGLNIGYCLSWLRTEENQYLSSPPHIARTYPPALQRLAGYTMSDHGLGYFGRADKAMTGPESVLGIDWTTDGQGLADYIDGALDPVES